MPLSEEMLGCFQNQPNSITEKDGKHSRIALWKGKAHITQDYHTRTDVPDVFTLEQSWQN